LLWRQCGAGIFQSHRDCPGKFQGKQSEAAASAPLQEVKN
jgi:hypothetical protein